MRQVNETEGEQGKRSGVKRFARTGRAGGPVAPDEASRADGPTGSEGATVRAGSPTHEAASDPADAKSSSSAKPPLSYGSVGAAASVSAAYPGEASADSVRGAGGDASGARANTAADGWTSGVSANAVANGGANGAAAGAAADRPAEPTYAQADPDDAREWERRYGQQYRANYAPGPYQRAYRRDDVIVSEKDHVIAGLLAIFLGCFGIHKFYLGYNNAGFIMLAVTVIGSLLTLGLAGAVMGVIGVIEGIVYLTKSQTSFDETYVFGRQEWF